MSAETASVDTYVGQTDASEKQGPGDRKADAVKRQKSRNRASVACASCRDKRTRCVVPPGKTVCTQCKLSGVDCIIKNDDERRRPISRAYMRALTDRINLLESMLRDQNVEPPPAHYPLPFRHSKLDGQTPNPPTLGNYTSAISTQSASLKPLPTPARTAVTATTSPSEVPGTPPVERSAMSSSHVSVKHWSSSPGSNSHEETSLNLLAQSQQAAQAAITGPDGAPTGTPLAINSSAGEDTIHRFLGHPDYISFEPPARKLVPSDLPITMSGIPGAPLPSKGARTAEQTNPAEKFIQALPKETHDYLMDLFWTRYNNVLFVIHQDAFEEDRKNGRFQFYSGFLHLCTLAIGFRYADKDRPDIQQLALPRKECTLHREAKKIHDLRLDRVGGIPNVIGLLLLSELECGVGRAHVGWMYAGMAIRQALEIGLHLPMQYAGRPEREVEIHRLALWACVIFDKYWSLFIGRATTMKSDDTEIRSLSSYFEKLDPYASEGPGKPVGIQIYETHLELMELVAKITEHIDFESPANTPIDRNSYIRMAALDQELNQWYRRLPDCMTWNQENIDNSAVSFFLIHQQYHASLIRLHLPYAKFDDVNSGEKDSSKQNNNANKGFEDRFSALSRDICSKHAIKAAGIYWAHRQRFDAKYLFVSEMHNAGTVATALISALGSMKNPSDRLANVRYLEVLYATLQDMAVSFQPAEGMAMLLHTFIKELRSGGVAIPRNIAVPNKSRLGARRESGSDTSASSREGALKRLKMNAQREASKAAPQYGALVDMQCYDTNATLDAMLASMAPLLQSYSGYGQHAQATHRTDDASTPRSEPSSWLHPSMTSLPPSVPLSTGTTIPAPISTGSHPQPSHRFSPPPNWNTSMPPPSTPASMLPPSRFPGINHALAATRGAGMTAGAKRSEPSGDGPITWTASTVANTGAHMSMATGMPGGEVDFSAFASAFMPELNEVLQAVVPGSSDPIDDGKSSVGAGADAVSTVSGDLDGMGERMEFQPPLEDWSRWYGHGFNGGGAMIW